MKTLALIPARGQSKRIARKNLAMIGGKPLVQIAIEVALDAGCIDQVVVSTDDHEIGAIATDWNVECIRRPADLAGDDVPMIDVVRHAMGKYEFDRLVLLQPTSPFRTDEHISAALELMDQRHADGVISVVQRLAVGEYFRFSPFSQLTQALTAEDVFAPNGAIYAITREALAMGEDWWTAPHIVGYIMTAAHSIDIDTPADLQGARDLWETSKA